MISLEQFGQNVKAKYPDDVASDGRRYADIPDIEIAQKWIKANPEYASQVEANDPFTNPEKTTTFTDSIHQMDPSGEQSRSLIEQSLPAAGAVAGGAGGATLGAAGGPVGSFVGGVAGATTGAAAGDALKQELQTGFVDPTEAGKTGLEFGALEAIGGPVAKVAGNAIKKVGRKVAEAVIPTSMQEAAKLQTYKAGRTFADRVAGIFSDAPSKAPATAASTAFNQGLVGTQTGIGVKAKRTANEVWTKIVDPALKKAEGNKIKMDDFFASVENKIISENPEPNRRTELLEALTALKEGFKNFRVASPEQLQKFKEGWAEFIPDKAYQGKPIAAAYKEVQDYAAHEARKTIYDAIGPEAKQAYFDYGNLQALQKLGQTAMTGSKLKGGSFTGLHALWDMAAIPVGTTGGQTIYKVGSGLEIIGQPGARTIRDALGIPVFGSDSNSGGRTAFAPIPQGN